MSPVLGIIASSNQQGRSVSNFGSYDSIASYTVPSGGVSSFTFSGIPIGYRNLEIYWKMQTSVADRDMWMQFNGDTSSAYNNFIVYGASSGVASYVLNAQTKIIWAGGTTTTSEFAAGTTTIYNASSSVTNKAVQAIYGNSVNTTSIGTSGTSNVSHGMGNWANLNPINAITISVASGVISANSSFQLYGVK